MTDNRSLVEIYADMKKGFESKGVHIYSITDKGREIFGFLEDYDILFAPFKHTATNILEIGIRKGGSIAIWKEYFPASTTIHGIDISKRCKERIHLDNVQGHVIDQGNKEELSAWAKGKEFDIIIDDGSHLSAHQILTFECLWPHLKYGGIYIIEDTITSYYNHYVADSPISCVNYFKNLTDEINYSGDIPNVFTWVKPETNFSMSLYQRTVDYIRFKCNLIVIKKRIEDRNDERLRLRKEGRLDGV